MQKPQDLKGNRFPIYSSSNFGIELEYSEEVVALHIKDFVKLNTESFRQANDLLTNLLPFLKLNGYQGIFAAIGRKDDKLKRLASLLNFKYVGSEKSVDIFIKED